MNDLVDWNGKGEGKRYGGDNMNKISALSRVKNLDKNELVKLVTELVNLRRGNKAYVEAKLSEPSELPKAIKHFKKIIEGEFFPRRGEPKMRLAVAKKAVRDFKKATNSFEGILDLMIFYVEAGTKFTNTYGDIDEHFYSSMDSTFKEVIDILKQTNDAELTRKFRPRLKAVVESSEGIGWGYYDHLCDFYGELR